MKTTGTVSPQQSWHENWSTKPQQIKSMEICFALMSRTDDNTLNGEMSLKFTWNYTQCKWQNDQSDDGDEEGWRAAGVKAEFSPPIFGRWSMSLGGWGCWLDGGGSGEGTGLRLGVGEVGGTTPFTGFIMFMRWWRRHLARLLENHTCFKQST